MTTVFENPVNGYRVKVDGVASFLWTSLIGPFYFLFRGYTLHFFLWYLFALTGLGPFIYPFVAAKILRKRYYERGYRMVEQRPTDPKVILVPTLVVIAVIVCFSIISSRSKSPGTPSRGSAVTSRRDATAASSLISTTSDTVPSPSIAPVAYQPPQTGQTEVLYAVSGTELLNVRSGPGASFPTTERLSISYEDIRIVGPPVMNDTTEWVPIAFGDHKGWVARRFLKPQDTEKLNLPSGTYQATDEGGILTLPSGEKFVSKTIETKDGMNDVLIFPNGQRFTSETAKGAGHVPYVSEDRKLVAIVRYPATQTHTLHIYLMANDGTFREIKDANQQVARLLNIIKGQGWAKAAESALDLDSMSAHVLTLTAIDVGYDTIPESTEKPEDPPTCQFRLKVSTDGSLSLAPGKESPTQDSQNASPEARTGSPPSTPKAASPLDLKAEIAGGPTAEDIEVLIRKFIAPNSSFFRIPIDDGTATQHNNLVIQSYKRGMTTTEIRSGILTNEYTREIDGETFYVYDMDAEVAMAGLQFAFGGPKKVSLSFSIVQRGKKLYIQGTPK